VRKKTIITESILLLLSFGLFFFCVSLGTPYYSSFSQWCFIYCQSFAPAAIITDWSFRIRHGEDLEKATDGENNAMFCLSFSSISIPAFICYVMAAWSALNQSELLNFEAAFLPFFIVCAFVYVVGWFAEFFFLRALHERYKD